MTLQDIKNNPLRTFVMLAGPVVVCIASFVPPAVGAMLAGVLAVLGGGMVKRAADKTKNGVPRLDG